MNEKERAMAELKKLCGYVHFEYGRTMINCLFMDEVRDQVIWCLKAGCDEFDIKQILDNCLGK